MLKKKEHFKADCLVSGWGDETEHPIKNTADQCLDVIFPLILQKQVVYQQLCLYTWNK